jgi:SAM-dependent methyltransferase
MSKELDQFIEDHLNLQVQISYKDHHDFLLRHQMLQYSRILDIGTGNGSFVARLANDHPGVKFFGIDKRKNCIDSCQRLTSENLEFRKVDMFSRDMDFNLAEFDGFLMRYFLLHVDNAKKILELLKHKAMKPSRLWIIDLDWSKINSEPQHPSVAKLAGLVKDFCSKVSADSMGGQRILPILEELGYQNITVEEIPFSHKNVSKDDLALYLTQEVKCYSHMKGESMHDPDADHVIRFIEREVKTGNCKISYGMVLISAEFGP